MAAQRYNQPPYRTFPMRLSRQTAFAQPRFGPAANPGPVGVPGMEQPADNPYPTDQEISDYLDSIGAPNPQQPQLAATPRGPFGLPGRGTDLAALSILDQMNRFPQQPHGFGQALAQSFAQSLAASRLRDASSRDAANQAAMGQYDSEVKSRQAMASAAGRMLYEHKARLAEERARIADERANAKPNEAYITLDTPDKVAAFKAQFPKIPIPPDGIVPRSALFPSQAPITLSPEAMQKWSDYVGQTGQLPGGLGMGSPQLKSSLLEGGAKALPAGQSFAGNKADYAANAAALRSLTQQSANAGAYSNMLTKNIGVLHGYMKSISDLGSEYANAPYRAFKKHLGGVNQAQFEAALRPVILEANRLQQTPGASSVPIHQKEMDDMRAVLSKNFTIDQLEGVLQVIQQDQGNKVSGYNDEINYRRNQLGMQPLVPETPPPANNGGGGWFKNNAPAAKKP